MDANLESNALSRIFESFALPPEAAGSLSRFSVDENLQNRIDELASKANEGELTNAESQEYSSYVRAETL